MWDDNQNVDICKSMVTIHERAHLRPVVLVIFCVGFALHRVCLGFYSFMPHVNKTLGSLSFCALFLLALPGQGSSTLLPMTAFPSLPFWNVLIECLAVNGHLGCTHSLTTVNRDSGAMGCGHPGSHLFHSVQLYNHGNGSWLVW